MISEYTSLGISKQIKEAGIDVNSDYAYMPNEGITLFQAGLIEEYDEYRDRIPAYTTQQAFDWLRRHKSKYHAEIIISEIAEVEIWERLTSHAEVVKSIYGDNLADMLWSAIIWIKENEQ